jgi:hypothetical protein
MLNAAASRASQHCCVWRLLMKSQQIMYDTSTYRSQQEGDRHSSPTTTMTVETEGLELFQDEIPASNSGETQPAVKDARKLEQQRSNLKTLYHAATCQCQGENCPDVGHCLAVKRLYRHVLHCHIKGSTCVVPGCRKMRRVWGHYRRCTTNECVLCSAVPTLPASTLKESRNQRPALSSIRN